MADECEARGRDSRDESVRILILYTEVTGYSLSCWQALSEQRGVALRVISGGAGLQDNNNGFRVEAPPPWLEVLHRPDLLDTRRVVEAAARFHPDVVIVSGWGNPAFNEVVYRSRRGGWRVVLALDTSLTRLARQLLGRVVLWRLLRNVDMFFVPGERGRDFLHRVWGVSHERIRNGLYGIDAVKWNASCAVRRQLVEWPRCFQFVGRYVATKGVRELIAGFELYRRLVENPMSLRFCGAGPLEGSIRSAKGVLDMGFRQPSELGDVLASAGCLVLPSGYDPWPLALVEAAASGLPLVAGIGCGSAVEVLRDGFNGHAVKSVSRSAIADALVSMHRRYGEWPVMGERSAVLASAYSSEAWAQNCLLLLEDLSNAWRKPVAVVAPDGYSRTSCGRWDQGVR